MRMEIKNEVVVGTLESCDAQVTIGPSGEGIVFTLQSSVINQYGRQIKRVVLETLENLDVSSATVKVIDRGALDCTIKARVEGAVFRASGWTDKIPWGVAVK
jgi:citrate lyase subunit gamma (acyl carrier protein)